MAESIKKFIIKDAHGGTKESGSFSVVGEVHVDIVPGYGEPYAESEYVGGVLTITIHNIEGNGITEITTNSKEGDEAVNTVTIKTNANPEGVVLEVRNGSRGNGIASSSEVLSPDDGGTNTHTFTDDDGNEHTFHTKNGRKGTKGDSFQPIEDVSGLVLAHTTGQDNTKAMSQKGVTDALDDTQNAMGEMVEIKQWSVIPKAGFVDGNVITAGSSSSTQYCLWYKVNVGDKVTITATNTTTAGFRVAFTDVVPAVGVTVQGKTDIGGTSVNSTIESPVDGYIVLNHSSSAFADKVVKILRKGNYTELQEKAPLKTLMDVVDMAGYALSKVEAGEEYSNSLNLNGNLVTKASDSYRTWEFQVQDEKLYHIHGRIPGTGSYAGYVFYDDQWMSLSHGEEPNGSSRTFDAVFMSPKGAAYLRVSGTLSESGKLEELVSSKGTGQKRIYPKMYYEHLSGSNNSKGFFCVNFLYNSAVSTIRFIKVNGDFTVLLEEDRGMRVFQYNSAFSCIRYEDYSITANEELTVSVKSDVSYIKIMLMEEIAEGSADISMIRMQLKGSFPDNWDTFNVSQFDEGKRQMIVARVHCTDPTACDNDSSDVQDTGEYFADCGLISQEKWQQYGNYLWDFGGIFLPKTYSNTGLPTRLIIYCHGAAVNYNSDVTSNGNSVIKPLQRQDIEPKYWLAEGYAVMDIEGNPFDNENEHVNMPQAMDCYVAAYKWAIEHYNLKRDGVFLGGRSMGGGTTFSLMRSQCPIPVIAACPNSSSTLASGDASAVRKDFYARGCGFSIPEGHTWGNNVLTDADKAVYLANWDKWIKNIPIFSMVTDMPTTEQFKQQFTNCFTNESEERVAMWSAMHAIAPCPVKLFACYEDETVAPQYGSEVFYNMFKNCGQIVELRLFHSYKDYSGTGTSAHHYDTQDPAIRSSVTTRFGEELTDIPVVYIEMLKFWRRFEQE